MQIMPQKQGGDQRLLQVPRGLRHTYRTSSSSSSSSSSSLSSPRSRMQLKKAVRPAVANKEIVKRALTPPTRRLSLRWLNFRPTPSRLSNMSTA